MHERVESKRQEIDALCRRLDVLRLDLFGSAAGSAFNEVSSDVDLLVEFSAQSAFDYFGSYFALKEGLEQILGLPVDLVSSSSIKNPYFRRQVMATKETLYVA